MNTSPVISPQRTEGGIQQDSDARRERPLAERLDLRSLKARHLVLICLLGFALVMGAQATWDLRGFFSDGIQDFTGFYVGARLVGTDRLYDVQANLAVQKTLVRQPSDTVIFVRPAYFAALLWPLAHLTYVRAVLVWKALQILALAAFVLIFPNTPRKISLTALCCSAAAVNAVVMGQDSPFVIVWIALALLLRVRGNPVAAGMVLALCAEKWHLFLLLPVVFIGKREWRLAAGFVAGSAALAGACFVIQGPGFLRQYYAALTIPHMNALPWLMPNLAGALCLFRGAMLIQTALSLMVVASVALICRRWPFEVSFAASILGSLIIAPHAYIHDWTISIPALLILHAHIPRVRLGTIILGSPLLGGALLFSKLIVLEALIIVAAMVALACLILDELMAGPEVRVRSASSMASSIE